MAVALTFLVNFFNSLNFLTLPSFSITLHSSTTFNFPRWDCVDCPVSLEKRASQDCKARPDPLERTANEAVPVKRDLLAASDPQAKLVSPAWKGHPDCQEIPVRREDPDQKVTRAARERTAWMAKPASEERSEPKLLSCVVTSI